MTARTAGQLTAADLGRGVTVTCRVVALPSGEGWGPTVEFDAGVPEGLAGIGRPQYVTLPADAPIHVHDDREPEQSKGLLWARLHGLDDREPDGEEVRRGARCECRGGPHGGYTCDLCRGAR